MLQEKMKVRTLRIDRFPVPAPIHTQCLVSGGFLRLKYANTEEKVEEKVPSVELLSLIVSVAQKESGISTGTIERGVPRRHSDVRKGIKYLQKHSILISRKQKHTNIHCLNEDKWHEYLEKRQQE